MATGMLGANTDLLREIAGRFGTQTDVVRDAGTTSGDEVEGVEWVGRDADDFRGDYRAIVVDLKALAIVLEIKERELVRQADEQDVASGAGAGGGLPTGPGGGAPVPGQPGTPNPFADPLTWLPDLRNPFRALRFLTEGTFALLNRDIFGKFWTTSWTGITGQVNGWGRTGAGIEAALEASRIGKPYTFLKNLTDAMNAKFLSVPIEKFITGRIDSVFNLQPISKFVAGADGVISPTSVSRSADALHSFLGKEGRLLGRGFGAFSVGLDAMSTFQSFQSGDYQSAAWNGAKTALGVASFIPGPVGWTAAGISAGIAIYENREAIANGAKWVGNKVGGFLSSINPFK